MAYIINEVLAVLLRSRIRHRDGAGSRELDRLAIRPDRNVPHAARRSQPCQLAFFAPGIS